MTIGKTYGTLALRGDGYVLSNMPPFAAMRLKQVLPRVAMEATQPFYLRGGAALASDLAWFMQKYPLDMDDATRAQLETACAAYERARVEVSSVLAGDWKPTPNPRFREGYAPRPHQAQAAEIASRLGRLLVMDDVGLGKTITAIAAIADAERLPAAVVVQSHLAKQWANKYVHRFTTLRAHVIKGRKPYPLPEADVYIFKYSNIVGWVDYVQRNRPFRSVIWDEIQELRHGIKTSKGRAAAVFTAQADLRLGLSATPIFNYGSEMFNIIEAIEPGALGSWPEFLIAWCRRQGAHWIVSDPVALGSYLRDQNLVIQRDENDVGAAMPPPNVVVETVDHDESVAEASRELTRQLAMRVVSGSFHERGKAALELDALVRRDTGLAKARAVAAYTRMLLETGRPVVLAGWHRDVYDIWLRELAEYSPLLYTGTETEGRKTKVAKAFIEGRTNLMIMSLRSGAGLDGLQHRCSTVVFGELDWSPEVHKQLIGRFRRDGNPVQIDAIYLHANFGSDPGMIEALGLKASQSHGIVKATEVMPPQYSDLSRIQKLAQSYLDGARLPPEVRTKFQPQMAFDLEGI